MSSYSPTSPAPEVQSISPSTFVAGTQNMPVEIVGTSFNPGAMARFSSHVTNRSTDFVDSNRLVAHVDVEGGATGSGDVIITNPDGQQGTLAQAYAISPAIATAQEAKAPRPKAKKKAGKVPASKAGPKKPAAKAPAAKKSAKVPAARASASKAGPKKPAAKKSAKTKPSKTAPSKQAATKRPQAKKASAARKTSSARTSK
jgi:hypothetical protein